jgi:predicted nucleic acid-binding protein
VSVVRAVLDACVLAPHPLYDTLLRLAEVGLFRPLWSAEILAETERTVIVKLGEPPAKARRRIEVRERFVPGAMTVGFEHLVPDMGNDPKDRHILAAAVGAGADVIVTANLTDFPDVALTVHGLAAVHPDDFLLGLLAEHGEKVLDCLRRQRGDYTNPVQSTTEFYDSFTATTPRFAARCAACEQSAAS